MYITLIKTLKAFEELTIDHIKVSIEMNGYEP
jgi:hypothetical protein